MGSSKGYILLHRQVCENKFYFNEPFCKSMAWIDLLLMAAHKQSSFMVRGINVIVPRGSVAYSLENLRERWKWSKGKVKRYFSVLQRDGQIDLQKSNIITIISIRNYDKFQSRSTANKSANRYASGTTDGYADGLHTKNVKRMNKEGGSQFANATAPPLDKPYAAGLPKSSEEIARELLTKKFKP